MYNVLELKDAAAKDIKFLFEYFSRLIDKLFVKNRWIRFFFFFFRPHLLCIAIHI